MDGRRAADLARGDHAARDDETAFAAVTKDRSNSGGVRVYVKGRWKLIEVGDRLEFYDLHADPDERTNLVHSRPEIANELRTLLRAGKKLAEGVPFD